MNEKIAKRLFLFPVSTVVQPTHSGARLTIAGHDLAELAEVHGTPLYVYDQATLEAALREYRLSLKRYYPGASGITYAGKAFLCTAMAQWVKNQELWLDCTGAGEIFVAVSAGVPRESILVHGVNKSAEDLMAAVQHAGTIVIDNLFELDGLASIFRSRTGAFPEVWLRLKPGIVVETHAYNQTGHQDSKFGMSVDEAQQAVSTCLHNELPLTGLHFHLGSLYHELAPLRSAITALLDFVYKTQAETHWLPQVLCTGGGWGVPYHEDDLPHSTIDSYLRYLADNLKELCQQRNLPLPKWQVEPGRSLVARAGVAIYRVGCVKATPNRRWLLLDGGLADNPRPALYRARYTALPVRDAERIPADPAWLAGPFCESGDVLIEELPMPEIEPGELIAVPVSGAYQVSMGSNYNGARRPAVVWLNEQGAHLIQERERLENLTARDHKLPEEGEAAI